MKNVALVVPLLLLPGCFLSREYVNAPIAPDAVGTLEPGRSTAADVVATLGAPNEVVQLGRRSAYLYEHVQRKTAGMWAFVVMFINADSQQDRTWVFFDENDVLTHAATTLDADDAEYAMPWTEHD